MTNDTAGPDRVDLHVHSHFSSDGDHPPRELLAMACAAGLRAIAVADHDVVDGSRAAVAAGPGFGVEVVPCVELTTFHAGRELHVLAYFIDTDQPAVATRLAQVRDADERRAREITAVLVRLGVDLEYEEAQRLTPHAVPKCSVLVRAAMTNGRNDGLRLFEPYRTGSRAHQPYHNFFLDHMRPGGDAYVDAPGPVFETLDAVVMVRGHGGAAVLAHAGSSLDPASRLQVITELAGAGLAGLEVHSSYHGAAEEDELARYCAGLGLVATAGSDFHGESIKPGIHIGPSVSSYGMVEALRARASGAVTWSGGP